MLKLRNILLHNYIYYILLAIAIIYFIITTCIIKYDTNYNKNTITANIKSITKKDYGLSIKLKGKENILALYYLDEQEMKTFLKQYSLNDKVKITYEKIPLTKNTTENTFNYKEYLYNNKIYNLVNIKSIKLVKKNKNILYKFKNYLLNKTNNLKTDPYIKSLILGDNSYLKSDVKESFKQNGISHLFAVSGLHIAIFSKILLSILKRLHIKENTRYIINILFLILYMFITNFTPSIVRSGVFSILILINKIKYFYIKNINILILSLSIIIFINPFIIYNIGFQFSFINTLFLILFSSKLTSKYKVISLLKTSTISFMASFPIMVNNFYQINILSIIYNLFYVPYISSVLLPSTIITYIFPMLDKVLNILMIILEKTSIFFSKINIGKIILPKMNIIHVIIYYIVLLFIIYKPKKIYYLILICMFIIHLNIKPNYDYLLSFDVGQGDSTLIYINNKATLIDTGGKITYDDTYYYTYSNNTIMPYLKSKGIRKIENLILTHGDFDHLGEAINLVENFKVEKVIFNCGEFNGLERNLIKVLEGKKIPYYSCIKELDIDNNKLYFLQTKDYGNENDNSNVIYLDFNNYKFLFMGDAGIKTEENIIEEYSLKDIDVLKVGHHGSKTSSSKDFIDLINPKYSIISVGKDNKYGHPNEEVLENLKKSKIYRTDQDGSIMFKIINDKLKIETCKP